MAGLAVLSVMGTTAFNTAMMQTGWSCHDGQVALRPPGGGKGAQPGGQAQRSRCPQRPHHKAPAKPKQCKPRPHIEAGHDDSAIWQ
jgi:hypothetical protein